MDEWLRYGTPESLSWYMFQSPKSAKSLHFNVIPRAIDDYLAFIESYKTQEPAKRIDNAVWSIHAGDPPTHTSPVSFALLLNLVGVANASDKAQLWAYFAKYLPDGDARERAAAGPADGSCAELLRGLREALQVVPPAGRQGEGGAQGPGGAAEGPAADTTDGELIQNEVYAVGKDHAFEPLRAWFGGCTRCCWAPRRGPRFGSFAAIYGLPQTIALIEAGANGELVA